MVRKVVAQLFGLLSRYGVEEVVCSPGSRNAVLIGVADQCLELKKTVVIDERSAAFIALGKAMVSRKPVALVCTSGTALLNYAPAVAEAYYQGIPIIVISADRPSEWIDQDDSQTIRQYGAFTNFVKASYDLNGDEGSQDYVWFSNRIFNEGLMACLDDKMGPVHFNIHLNGNIKEGLPSVDKVRKVSVVKPLPRVSNELIKQYVDFASDKKIMFVAGFMQPDNKLQTAVSRLAKLPNVSILAETLSNLHLESENYVIDPVFFSSESVDKNLVPDIVISCGGALISRKLKEFLRNNPPAEHWSFNQSDCLIDCFKSLSVKFEIDPAPFLSTFAKLLNRKHTQPQNNAQCYRYKADWHEARCAVKKNISSLPWCDLSALNIVLNTIPRETNLFLSNGTAVRYAQIIPYRITHATYSNRGVSGIEGSTSTAVGASTVYENLTCLITGDMSFSYDVSALGYDSIGANMLIVVLDNGGGDIFRFIGATKNLSFREKYLCCPRPVPFRQLAEGYGWKYYYSNGFKSLRRTLNEILHSGKLPAILHMDTSGGSLNSELLTEFLNNK